MSTTRVQGQATASSGAVTSQAATVGSGVTLGNLLVAAVSTGAIGNSVTPPSGWTQAVFNQPNSPANDETGLWYIVVGAGQSGLTSFTFTFGSSHNVYIIIEEWSTTNGWNASPVDQTQVGNTAGTATTSTTPNTGTTSTTTQASELWVATLVYSGGVQTESSITSGWTKDLETHDGSNNHTATMLYQVASSTGTASCQYTIGTTEHWAGAVATFKPIVVTTSTRTIPSTAALQSTTSRTITTTTALIGTVSRTIPATSALLQTSSRTIPATVAIAITNTRTVPATVALDQPSSRTVPATAALLATNSRTIPSTAALLSTNGRIVVATAALLNTSSRTISTTAALANTSTRTISAKVALTITSSRTVPASVALTRTNSRTVPTSAAISATSHRTIPTTAALTIEIASGGFGLYGNGTGTVTYDSVRVTEYPDPALVLAPVLARVGATSVLWNANIPTNTTLGMDISFDGVNWTDVTSQNGGSIPTLYSQPAPSIDGFGADTHTNYTNTYRTGGAMATWTYDTTNSRLIATGGTNAIFAYNAISRADVDFFADLDRADAGGLVWRYIDQNNFYYLLIGDTLASSGTTNTITLYKIASNVQTQLGTATISYTVGPTTNVFTRGTYRRFRVSMLSGVITCYVDGVQLLTYTDGSPLAAGLVGLYNNSGTTGSRYYQFWITPQGDYVSGTPAGNIVTGKFVYTRCRLATTDPTVTPQVLDLTTNAFNPNIQAGVTIPAITYNAAFISKNYDDLAKQSNFLWYIDANLNLYFTAGNITAAPWILQSAPYGLVSSVDLEVNTDLEIDVANDLYRNRQIILGALGSGSFTETKTGDGSTRTFTLGYSLASAPTISLNGFTDTSIGLKGTSGFDYYYALNDPVIVQDASRNVLQDTDQLTISYTGFFEVTVTVDNTAEQAAHALIAGGTGIVEAVEDHSGENLTQAAATTLANQLITRYATSGRTIIFDTSRNGLAVGMMLPVFLPEHGIWDGQFLINQVEITLQKGIGDTQIWWYKVTASELPKQASWAKLIASGLTLQ